MSKYKTFWIEVSNGNLFKTLIYPDHGKPPERPSIERVEVIELAALEACQKRLDEAVGLLKHTLNTFQHKADGMGEVAVIEGIEDFLKGLGEG